MNTQTKQGIEFTRAKSDIYGNPRYIVHFFELLTDNERNSYGLNNYGQLYALAFKRANKIGGRKYRGKNYGGGLVFQSYNIEQTALTIQAFMDLIR
jgi:hypothetical protein